MAASSRGVAAAQVEPEEHQVVRPDSRRQVAQRRADSRPSRQPQAMHRRAHRKVVVAVVVAVELAQPADPIHPDCLPFQRVVPACIRFMRPPALSTAKALPATPIAMHPTHG